MWPCKNIFAKAYVPDWTEEVFVIEKVKNTVVWMYAISDLNGKKNCFMKKFFYEKELWKTNQKDFRGEKVIKRKGHKLYVKIVLLKVGLIK